MLRRRDYLKLIPLVPPLAVEAWSSWQWYAHPNAGNWLLSAAMAAVCLVYLWLAYLRRGN